MGLFCFTLQNILNLTQCTYFWSVMIRGHISYTLLESVTSSDTGGIVQDLWPLSLTPSLSLFIFLFLPLSTPSPSLHSLPLSPPLPTLSLSIWYWEATLITCIELSRESLPPPIKNIPHICCDQRVLGWDDLLLDYVTQQNKCYSSLCVCIFGSHFSLLIIVFPCFLCSSWADRNEV